MSLDNEEWLESRNVSGAGSNGHAAINKRRTEERLQSLLVLRHRQWNNAVIVYLKEQLNKLVRDSFHEDEFELQWMDPDELQSHAIVSCKLANLKSRLYVERGRLATWFLKQESMRRLHPGPVSQLVLRSSGDHRCNREQTRCCFIVKSALDKMMNVAKERANRVPEEIPEEGYTTAYVLAAYFEWMMDTEIEQLRSSCASRIRQVHLETIVDRYAFLFMARELASEMHSHPVALPPPPPPPPLENLVSESVKRRLDEITKDEERQCSCCLDKDSITKETTVLFRCGHYVCATCFPRIPNNKCPECRALIAFL